MAQPCETLRYTAADHVRALAEHAGSKLFDTVILNTRPLCSALLNRYAAQRAEPVLNDLDQVRMLGVEPVCTDLLAEDLVARHDSRRLSQLVLDLVR